MTYMFVDIYRLQYIHTYTFLYEYKTHYILPFFCILRKLSVYQCRFLKQWVSIHLFVTQKVNLEGFHQSF